MSEIFLKIINMSISASYIVLAILLLRLILKKAPKWIMVLLWGIVAVRLICPFSFESVLSLIPSAETISTQALMETPEINTGVPIINNAINPMIQGATVTVAPEKSINALQLFVLIFSKIWIIGLTAMLIYTLISYFNLKRKIGTAVLVRDNIYQSENVVSPFVLGIIKPKIYLPFNINEKDMEYVVAHETAHIRRKDHWWKPLGFLLLTLHWFNPLMWLGYVLLCRDIELACDEKVVKKLDHDARANYSEALLNCSVNRRMIAACPLAFGEVGVKDRVKSVLSYKKPAFWIIIAAVVACVVVAVCFLTNPQQKVKDLLVPDTYWACESYDLTFQMDQNYVIEGDINTPNYNGKISIAFRYAGKKAVAEIFKGDWKYAQSTTEEPLFSGTFRADGNKLIFEVKDDNINLNVKELVFYKKGSISNFGGADKPNSLIYGFVPHGSDSDKLSYVICIHDFACDVKDATINFEKARFEDGMLIFDIHWTNEGSANIDIGPDFVVYKYDKDKSIKLEQKGIWELYLEILAGEGMSADDGFVFQHQRTTSYNLSAHYDVLTPGKYRFEAHGAWVEFQIIDDLSDFSVINDGKGGQ